LYPYLLDVFKSVILLNNNLVLEAAYEKEMGDESLDNAIEEVVTIQSERTSMSSTEEAAVSHFLLISCF